MTLIRPDGSDVRVIGYTVGRICHLMAIASILPVTWAALGREWSPFASFVLMAGAFAVLGSVLTASPPDPHRLAWSHGMVVVAVTWIVVPVVGSIPFVLSGHFAGPPDALFDALSGVTTTGLSLIQDVDHLAPSLNFWRHFLQFLGGQGIVIAALSLFAGGAGLTMYYGEARDEKVFPSVTSTARFIWAVSLAHLVFGVALLTVLGVIAVGFEPIRAAFHGLMIFFAGFDTGGFSPQSTSLGYYRSVWYEAGAGVLMIAGAMSFGLHFALWRGRRIQAFRNLETRTILATFGFTLVLVVAGIAALETYGGVFGLSRRGLFHALSAHTGTGFSTIPSVELLGWGGLAFGGITLAMAFGGMASSTAGGVKALRIGLTLKVLNDQVRAVLLPDRAVVGRRYIQSGIRHLTPQLAQSVMAVSLLYVALYLLGAGVGLAYGVPLEEALFESVSAAANVGLSVGVTDASMPVLLKATYMAQMYLGRLEFVAVFALLGFVVAWVRGQ